MKQDVVSIHAPTLEQIGQLANSYAASGVLSQYQRRLSPNTFRRQTADIALFVSYLAAAGIVISADDLLHSPESWRGITYGLVDGFVRWMVQEGYAIGSINVRLSTIKAYCKMVAKSGVIESTEYALIKLVNGYRHAEGRNIDRRREVTRKGPKKAVPVSISPAHALLLKQQPDTPQGRRDALLMCLLLDHGLRCGEVEALTVQSINLSNGTLMFYREKVDKTQIHELSRDTLLATMKYLQICTPTDRLLMGSRKTGVLCGRMSSRAITDRVRVLGAAIGLHGLSAHDCRHYWATAAVKGGTDLKSLQDAGGWNSPAMPLRYAESGKVANQGVRLG